MGVGSTLQRKIPGTIATCHDRVIRKYESLHTLPKAILVTISIYGAFWYFPGFLFQSHYGQRTLSFIDGTITVALIAYMLTASIPIFAVLFWFPRQLGQLTAEFDAVARNPSLAPPTLFKGWHVVASTIIVGLVVALYAVGLSKDAVIEWFEVYTWWAWAFPIALMGFQAIPAVILLFGLKEFLHWFAYRIRGGLTINMLDPDGCGGLGFIATTFRRLSLFAVSLGFWVLAVLWTNWQWNNQGGSLWELPVEFFINVALLTSAYVALIWSFLLWPALLTSKVMKRERDKLLSELAKEFSQRFQNEHVGSRERAEALQRISMEYNLIKQSFPTSLFPIGSWRGLGILAILPPSIGLTAAIIDILKTI